MPAAKGRVAEAFGLYPLPGKATTFIGPYSIVLVTGFLASEAFDLSTRDAQHLGVTPVGVLFVIGPALLPF